MCIGNLFLISLLMYFRVSFKGFVYFYRSAVKKILRFFVDCTSQSLKLNVLYRFTYYHIENLRISAFTASVK